MHKTAEEWAKVQAAAVTSGSVAQATNVLQVALDDIQRQAFFLARQVEAQRHYDRDGYCDNPARGY